MSDTYVTMRPVVLAALLVLAFAVGMLTGAMLINAFVTS